MNMSAPDRANWPRVLPGFEHVKRSWSADFGLPQAKILPGEYYVTAEDEIVATLLGSCVAACIRDPRTGVGGMNHFLLPGTSPTSGLSQNVDTRLVTRYGVAAMESLVNALLKQGARKSDLELKLFGGGNVMDMALQQVGSRNVEFVREFARLEGLTIAAEHLGGDRPRRVLYFPRSGRVLMKRLQRAQFASVVSKEREYAGSLEREEATGEICLFD